jgi:6-pyruvoyltetrahydropterin/6-carboxytetrahydropterin synthase
MTTATIRREYTLEAAHRLPYVPEGHKCGNVHGHSYRVTVFVRGPISSMGWVVDFADVDAVARPVIARLDHTNLNALLPNPTSELLCVWLLRQLRAVPHLYAVSVSETERSMAMVTVDDLDAAAGEPTARAYLGSRGIARAQELAAAVEPGALVEWRVMTRADLRKHHERAMNDAFVDDHGSLRAHASAIACGMEKCPTRKGALASKWPALHELRVLGVHLVELDGERVVLAVEEA